MDPSITSHAGLPASGLTFDRDDAGRLREPLRPALAGCSLPERPGHRGVRKGASAWRSRGSLRCLVLYCLKKPGVGAVRSDKHAHAPAASRAVTDVGRTLTVSPNATVHPATAEVHPYPRPATLLPAAGRSRTPGRIAHRRVLQICRVGIHIRPRILRTGRSPRAEVKDVVRFLRHLSAAADQVQPQAAQMPETLSIRQRSPRGRKPGRLCTNRAR